MAFILRSGGRFQVRHGVTGELLATYASRDRAQAELQRLHRKHDPTQRNRGASARARELTRRRRGSG